MLVKAEAEQGKCLLGEPLALHSVLKHWLKFQPRALGSS